MRKAGEGRGQIVGAEAGRIDQRAAGELVALAVCALGHQHKARVKNGAANHPAFSK